MSRNRKRGLLKRLQWGVECSSFLALERLGAFFAMPSLWRAGAGLSVVGRLFSSRWNIVRSNLRTAVGPTTSEEDISVLTREVFRHTAANLLTALKSAQLPSPLVREVLAPENIEVFERAFRKGKGVILVSAHMGNFELLAQGLGAFRPEIRIAGIYRPLNNIYLDTIIRERRAHRGMKLFAKLTSYHGPIKWVRNQGVLGIVADQRAGRSGSITPFFGRLMSMSPLPAFIHKHTGAPIIGISMKTTSPGRWKVAFHELEISEGENVTTAHIASLLETIVTQSIVDVFWMQDLWRMNIKRPLKIPGRKGPIRLEGDRNKPLYPFSILVRVPDNGREFAQTIPALTALAHSRPDCDLHLLARERIRDAADSSGVAHTFHSIEGNKLPPGLVLAIAFTDHERTARELAHLYAGPTYTLSAAMQSRENWHSIPIEESLSPEARWLGLARSLGMHDPPLQWTYV